LSSRRLGVVLVTIAAVIGVATPAWAHVTIEPSQAPKGSDAVLAFTVPNEMDNADTTKVEITFPTDHPIADASVEPVTGWTATVQMTKVQTPIKTDSGSTTDAVQSVTWTGGAIKPGQFQQFTVSVGLPDDADSLEFKALQTYSNGQVVRWIEDTPKGGPEPENPAPVLTLTSASDTGESASASTQTAASTSSSTSDSTARTLGIVGIVVGALGLAVAGVALATRRRTA
jgi:MYXO-CTERM domain-containing protein